MAERSATLPGDLKYHASIIFNSDSGTQSQLIPSISIKKPKENDAWPNFSQRRRKMNVQWRWLATLTLDSLLLKPKHFQSPSQ